MKKSKKVKSQKADEKDLVRLSTPWASTNTLGGQNFVTQSSFGSHDITRDFVKERSRVHELYIREQEKTKRLGLIIGALLIILASMILMLAPGGREVTSYWISAVLLVFAGGAVGYKRIWGKSKLLSVGADQNNPESDERNTTKATSP